MIVGAVCAVLHKAPTFCSYVNTSSQVETSIKKIRQQATWLQQTLDRHTPLFQRGGIGLLTYFLGFPLELGQCLKEFLSWD